MSDEFLIISDVPTSARLFNPIGFDPKDFLPEALWKHADSARYLIHTIHHNRFLYRRRPTAFIELKSAYLNRFFVPKAAFPIVRKCLHEAGVIECDMYYIEGRKSYGYRLGSTWANVEFTSTKVTNRLLLKKLQAKAAKQTATQTAVHSYLQRWLEQLDFDYEEATRLIAKKKIRGQRWALEALRDRNLYFSTCDYGRVHSNITNLHTPLRRFLSFNNKKLVNLDIKNSQPLLFAIVLINYLTNNESLKSLYNWTIDEDGYYILEFLQLANKNQQDTTPTPVTNTSPLRFPNLIRGSEDSECWKDTTLRLMAMGVPEDGLRYVELVQRGELYEYLMGHAGVGKTQRKRFKRSFFKNVFFCRNEPVKRQAGIFRQCFPSVYEAVVQLKRRDYRSLAHILQRTESSLVINRIARRCMTELPEVCIVTIHDSILTTPEAADSVLEIMREEFNRLGLDPTITVQ